jgi:hypothetical protein
MRNEGFGVHFVWQRRWRPNRALEGSFLTCNFHFSEFWQKSFILALFKFVVFNHLNLDGLSLVLPLPCYPNKHRLKGKQA